MPAEKYSSRSAFMAVDVQNRWANANPATVFRLNSALSSLRKRMPIFWVFMIDGTGMLYETAGIQNPRRWTARSWEQLRSLYRNHDLAPTLRPHGTDWVTLKDEADGFGNLKLGPFLKQHGIDHLIVGGFLSQQCVLQTMTGARYYERLRVTFAADLSADIEDKCLLTPEECKSHNIRWHQRKAPAP
jgi:nicotinamidase-related amidase